MWSAAKERNRGPSSVYPRAQSGRRCTALNLRRAVGRSIPTSLFHCPPPQMIVNAVTFPWDAGSRSPLFTRSRHGRSGRMRGTYRSNRSNAQNSGPEEELVGFRDTESTRVDFLRDLPHDLRSGRRSPISPRFHDTIASSLPQTIIGVPILSFHIVVTMCSLQGSRGRGMVQRTISERSLSLSELSVLSHAARINVRPSIST